MILKKQNPLLNQKIKLSGKQEKKTVMRKKYLEIWVLDLTQKKIIMNVKNC